MYHNVPLREQDIHLTPSTDFYKKLALDCSGQQVAVDLFLLSGQYSDLASLGKPYEVVLGHLTPKLLDKYTKSILAFRI